MTTQAILANCATLGVTLRLVDGRLIASPGSALPENLRVTIRANKEALIEELKYGVCRTCGKDVHYYVASEGDLVGYCREHGPEAYGH